MKKIWKTKTSLRDRSLRKSARRMARCLRRLPVAVARGEIVLENYFRNKTEEEKTILEKLLTEAIIKNEEQTKRKGLEITDIITKQEGIRNRINSLIVEYTKSKFVDVKLAKHIQNYLKMLIDSNIEYIIKLEDKQKRVRKDEITWEKKAIQIYEHECISLLRQIRIIEEQVSNVESEQ